MFLSGWGKGTEAGEGGNWKGLELKQVSLKAGRKEEQTNLHRVGSGRAVEAWWAWEGLDAEMGGSSQGHEERDKRLPLTMLRLFPSTNPRSVLWLFAPLHKYCLAMQTQGSAASLGSLPSHHKQLSVAAPTPSLPVSISPSPHCQSTHSPLWTFSPGWIHREGKIFRAKTVMSTWCNAQALFPMAP